jgi:hypothetical protein
MRSCTHVILEQIPPDVAGEDRIPIADDRRREAVESDDVSEESSGDRRCRVRVAERYEVSVLQQAVDHHKYDALAVHLG